MTGCAQQVLSPQINEATVRLLTRHGVEVVVAEGAGCCGAMTHHMGREAAALASAKSNVAAWSREAEAGGLDAVIINASGCGTTVKDYGFMLRTEPEWADKAENISALTKDLCEFMDGLGLGEVRRETGLRVAYHAACSLQHGQKITAQPKALLGAAGFAVSDVPEGHLCCGSAGTYNLLQPKLANALRERKLANIAKTSPQVIATGQYRLHGAARRRHGHARRPHGGAFGLGDRRTAAQGARRAEPRTCARRRQGRGVGLSREAALLVALRSGEVRKPFPAYP